jgi:hypothetical protein
MPHDFLTPEQIADHLERHAEAVVEMRQGRTY